MAPRTADRLRQTPRAERQRAKREHEDFIKAHEAEFQRKMLANREKERRRLAPAFCRLIGEITPGVNAANTDEALIVALQFSRALGLEQPVVPGETSLVDVERRVWHECVRRKRWYLAEDNTLSPIESDLAELGAFNDVWIPLAGSDQPISQEM